jgi:hypothetical protein
MEEYATVTGDWDGVEIVDENGKNVTRGKCWNDYFWYPPACRDTCQIRLQVLSPETPEESVHLRETTLGYPRNRGIMDGGL